MISLRTKLLTVAVVLLALACYYHFFGFSPPPGGTVTHDITGPTKTESELRQILENTCLKVNDFYRAEHFSHLVSSPDNVPFAFHHDTGINENSAIFQNPNPDGLYARLVAETGYITHFANNAAVPPENPATYGGTPHPNTWPQDRVLAVAGKFADIFAKPWGKLLGPPQIENDGDGKWTVRWPEISPSGIQFEEGGVEIQLTEKYGPYTAELDLSRLPYSDESVVPVSKDVAVKTALDALAKGQADPKSALSGGVIDQDSPTLEQVIAPVFSDGRISSYHLAWQVTFKFQPGKPNVHGNSVGAIIDAKTGQVLELMMPLSAG